MNVEYNGVYLQYASITSWDETVEYDSSGMNLIANKISLTIEGSVFPLLNSYNELIGKESTNVALEGYELNSVSIPDGTKSFAFRLNTCLRNLSLPRHDFIMKNAITEEVYFEAYAYDLTELGAPRTDLSDAMRRNIDVNGGPKPRNVRVIQTCNEFARISFSIEITKIRCLAGEVTQSGEILGADPTLTESASANFVVSNRCWTEETMDANFYVTRVFSGKLRISSILTSVHFYRDMYYPPLEDGFRRDSVRFSESEDGLELSYSVTDKQVRCSAPYPATAFSGNCSYSISNSAEQEFNMNLTMIGRPDASKPALVSRCMQAVYAKLKEVKKVGNGIMRKLNISENLGDPPSVTVTASYMLVSKEASTSNGSTLADTFLETTMLPAADLIGHPLEWDPLEINGYTYVYRRLKSPVPNPYGYNVFSAYGDEETSPQTSGETNVGTGDETSGKTEGGDNSGSGTGSGTAKHNPSYGYIKCLATAPCRIRPPKYAQENAAAAKLEKELTTKIVKDEPGTEYLVTATDVNEDAIEYPYSFYKSDITYFTDYSRIVLPKAPRVSVNEESSLDDSSSDNDEDDDLSTVRIIEVAQPVPKARIVIEAERFGRLPEMPNPDEIVTTTGDNPIVFTCLKSETQICDPRAARNTQDSVSYSIIGTYEYAMSRQYKLGDEIWLLQNPTFGSTCYYPKKISEVGDKVDDLSALTYLYNGKQLSHLSEDIINPPTPINPDDPNNPDDPDNPGGDSGETDDPENANP